MSELDTFTLALPSKYASKDASASAPATQPKTPSIEWLERTWTVTHSTLSMWRSARNVRISYKRLPAKSDGRARIDDLVEYEPIKKTGVLSKVEGVDTQAADGSWNWRGKGWLFFVTSHWELLGSGEVKLPSGETERWAVTWFAPTVFTSEGLDVYCDKEEGISSETYSKISEALTKIGAKGLVDMVNKDMKPVEIKLPWTKQ
ncbi:hypothetical protein VHEMI00133 [[Torrubiella] hemipterigena]|uniref:Histidinolphosphatase-like protein n=1 Tax=[Torrubiella] hemipterigena TaxID=1531966 RepID=A0A0A1T105_9HYPO|nr:hypothetical protein VHEMI00133 [[Torrubiella] hemipterigena]